MSIPSSASSTPESGATAEAADIRGLKPLETFSYPFYFYASAAALALLLIAFLFLIFRWFRRRAKRESLPASIPPEELTVVILRQLDHLKTAVSNDHAALRRIHFDLSEIFRNYLEGRFHFPASDWTTEEILAFLYADTIRKILVETDQVKFAGARTDSDATLALIEEAIAFVEVRP